MEFRKTLQQIDGINKEMATRLVGKGFDSLEKLVDASNEELADITGLTEKAIEDILEQARHMQENLRVEEESLSELTGDASKLKTEVERLVLNIRNRFDDSNAPKEHVKELRKESRLPVIMLTARGDDLDRILGLELGADDYVPKPCNPRELLARIKALLRRSAPQATDVPVEVRGLELDPVTHRVQAGEIKLELGPMEFRLLHFFMTHPERVYSRERILDSVWGHNVYVEERTVDVHIRRLRKALEPHHKADLIQTVRGAGYRFSAHNP